MSTNEKNQLASIELLRGLTALVVALYHYSNYFLPPGALLRRLFAEGYLGVEAFFVISGLVIPLSFARKNYTWRMFGGQFKKRLLRIEPAYWASIGLMLLIDAFGAWYEQKPWPNFTGWNLFLHLFHANETLGEPWLRGIYWTLAIDWQFYLLACAAFAVFNRSEWYFRYPLYAVFAAAHWASPYPWLPYHLLSFGAGVLLFHYYRGYARAAEVAVVLPGLLLAHWYAFDVKHMLATAIPCALILFVGRIPAWGDRMGRISYSYYLTHVFSGWTLLNGLAMLTRDPVVLSIGVLVATWISIPFAQWFYRRVEEPSAISYRNTDKHR